jgi:hypothetical protein
MACASSSRNLSSSSHVLQLTNRRSGAFQLHAFARIPKLMNSFVLKTRQRPLGLSNQEQLVLLQHSTDVGRDSKRGRSCRGCSGWLHSVASAKPSASRRRGSGVPIPESMQTHNMAGVLLLGVCNLTGVWRGHPEPGKITPPIIVEQSPPSLDFTVK